MDKAAVLAEIDAVFARCGVTPDNLNLRMIERPTGAYDLVGHEVYVETVAGNVLQMLTSLLACIERNASQQLYVRSAYSTVNGTLKDPLKVEALLGILLSVRQDIDAGFVRTLERRAQDEVFDDLLDMASHVATLHVAPGVVLAVSVLEERVRGLAGSHGIETTKPNGDARSFDDLATELYKAEVLTKPELKSLQSAYSQRTEAAHGHFDKVIASEVPRIIESVRDFLARHP